jgi:putative Mg2+ transporter-C (MgtC) family protein
MRFIDAFSLSALANLAFCLAAAFALGALIGAERQHRQRSAGLRTNVLVALGAAAFVDFGMRIAGDASTQCWPMSSPASASSAPARSSRTARASVA